MSKNSLINTPRRRNPFAFAASVTLIIAAVVAGIEISRRLISPSNNTSEPTARGQLAGATSGAPYPRELRDGSGATLRLMARPGRIVSQTLGTDEILLAICPPERIAALSWASVDPEYSPMIDQARALGVPAIKGAEEILRLNPDLIFVASYSRAEVVALLQTAGAPIFRFARYESIQDIKDNIRAIGYAIGEDERAAALVAQMEHEIEAVRARVPAGNRPRIMSYGGGVTAGAGTLYDDVIRMVGAINVSAERGLRGFPKVSSEQIVEWDPDFLITGAQPDKFDEARKALLADPAIASSRAGRAGRVIVLDNRYYLSVTHHIVRTMEALADGLYSAGAGRNE
ncbi:MAG: ABC transporter substrate-binding protein [Blastocatellia bacterium]